MVFLHTTFKEMKGAYEEATIQRSHSKQAFPESKQGPRETTMKEFF